MAGELDYTYLAELVNHARNGDSDAFAELYAATYQKEYRFAYHYLKDPYLAQDALQETYITALKNLHKLKDSMLFVSWLNQINFRICFNMHKKQHRYAEELSDYINSHMAAKPSLAYTPEEEIVHVDEQEYIMKKILGLPFTESQVILMKYYENMKLEEIASVLEISTSSVKRHLAKGREKLGKSLEH